MDSVTDAAVRTEGRLVVTGSADHTARIWDASSGKLKGEPLGHEAPVTGVAFINVGKAIVITLADASANVWDVNSGQLLRQMHGNQQGTGTGNGHNERIYNARFSPDTKLALTASREKSALVWQRYGEAEWGASRPVSLDTARVSGHGSVPIASLLSQPAETVRRVCGDLMNHCRHSKALDQQSHPRWRNARSAGLPQRKSTPWQLTGTATPIAD